MDDVDGSVAGWLRRGLAARSSSRSASASVAGDRKKGTSSGDRVRRDAADPAGDVGGSQERGDRRRQPAGSRPGVFLHRLRPAALAALSAPRLARRHVTRIEPARADRRAGGALVGCAPSQQPAAVRRRRRRRAGAWTVACAGSGRTHRCCCSARATHGPLSGGLAAAARAHDAGRSKRCIGESSIDPTGPGPSISARRAGVDDRSEDAGEAPDPARGQAERRRTRTRPPTPTSSSTPCARVTRRVAWQRRAAAV